MRQSRVYTEQPLLPAGSIELEEPASHYLARVLRLSEGDPLILFNGDGRDYLAEISGIRKKRVLVRVLESKDPANESPLKINLVQAICRGERMDYVLQKATELGVSSIQPLKSQRVEVRLDETRQAKRMVHWQRVVISACEQSGRALVPAVHTPLSLPEWMASADAPPRLVLDPFSESRLSDLSVTASSISILVGPEGGFTGEEMAKARARGVIPVSLGPRVLRTETAGPAAIAVVQAKAGDL